MLIVAQNDLEEMRTLNDSRLKILERLRDTMKEANDWKDEVEENSYLWLDDRKEHMRQFLLYGRSLEGMPFAWIVHSTRRSILESELDQREQIQETPPTLKQFQDQIDLFQSIYNDIDRWDQHFVFSSWLRVDARPIKRQLLVLVNKWIHL
jgi:dynein heavy chain, axonemal